MGLGGAALEGGGKGLAFSWGRACAGNLLHSAWVDAADGLVVRFLEMGFAGKKLQVFEGRRWAWLWARAGDDVDAGFGCGVCSRAGGARICAGGMDLLVCPRLTTLDMQVRYCCKAMRRVTL